jgi:hypothetical protein
MIYFNFDAVKTAFTGAADAKLSPPERLVLIALAMHANGKNQCYPPIKRLQELTGLYRKTIEKALKTLSDAEYLQTEKKTGAVNRYTLCLDKFRAAEPVQETTAETTASADAPAANIVPLRPDTTPPKTTGEAPDTTMPPQRIVKHSAEERMQVKMIQNLLREAQRKEAKTEKAWPGEGGEPPTYTPPHPHQVGANRVALAGYARLHGDQLRQHLTDFYQEAKTANGTPVHINTQKIKRSTRDRSLLEDLTDRSWAQ